MKLFLSYTSADKAWAHWIGVTLRDAGHELFVHEWEVASGENIPAWIERKLALADKMIGVFSPAYVQAIHSNAERWAAYWQDPAGADGFLVPIEIEKLDKWPVFAANKKRLSLIGLSEAEAEAALVKFLEPPTAPTTGPAFPGGKGPTVGGAVGKSKVGPVSTAARAVAAALAFSDGGSALPTGEAAFPSEAPNQEAEASDTAAPIITSREDLERWLKGKPREFGVVLALRAALRVAPLLVGLRARNGPELAPSVGLMPCFRGMAEPWAAAKFPARGVELYQRVSARTLTFHRIDVALAANDVAVRADAAAYAAAAAAAARAAEATAAADADASASTDAAAYAVAAAGYAAAAASSAAIWSAISLDAANLWRLSDATTLASAPLWPNGTPAVLTGALVELLNLLLSRSDENWHHWLAWLNDRIAGAPADEEKELARLTLPEEMWEAATKSVEGVKAVNAEIARRLAEIDERRRFEQGERKRDVPEPPALEPGQKYRFGREGLEFVPSDGPMPDFVRATQATIHGELRLAIADLRAISVAKGNEHPGLCAAVSRYAELIDRPLDHLDPTHLMTIGVGLTAYASAFQARDAALSMEGALEPTHFAELVRSAELHRALIFGFPELRPSFDRSDALRRGDPAAVATAARPLGVLLSGLAGARDWVSETTRQGLSIADDVYLRFGHHAWDASFNAYELVRNGLITTSVYVAEVFGLLATVPGAVALTVVDPSFTTTIACANAASTFLVAHADDITALAVSFPEMRAWFDWMLGRLRTLR